MQHLLEEGGDDDEPLQIQFPGRDCDGESAVACDYVVAVAMTAFLMTVGHRVNVVWVLL